MVRMAAAAAATIAAQQPMDVKMTRCGRQFRFIRTCQEAFGGEKEERQTVEFR
jgi:hypothetical protein